MPQPAVDAASSAGAAAAVAVGNIAGSALLAALIGHMGPAYVEAGMALAGGFFGAVYAVMGRFNVADAWTLQRWLALAAHLILPAVAALGTAGTAAYLAAGWMGLGERPLLSAALVLPVAAFIGRYAMAPAEALSVVQTMLDIVQRIKGGTKS